MPRTLKISWFVLGILSIGNLALSLSKQNTPEPKRLPLGFSKKSVVWSKSLGNVSGTSQNCMYYNAKQNVAHEALPLSGLLG